MNRIAVTLLICGFIFSTFTSNAYAFNAEATFNSVCIACHSIGQGRRVGPDLKGVTERRKEEWLIKFIRNPMEMVASDPVAKKLFKEYNQVPMPPQPTFKDADIKALLKYIKQRSK